MTNEMGLLILIGVCMAVFMYATIRRQDIMERWIDMIDDRLNRMEGRK